MNLNTYLTPYTVINLKLIIDLKVKTKPLSLQEKIQGKSLHNLCITNQFLEHKRHKYKEKTIN